MSDLALLNIRTNVVVRWFLRATDFGDQLSWHALAIDRDARGDVSGDTANRW